eukprot:m.23166 g.23166  ORF g.23166 m.23166 type:complete len:140 (+) comp7469_c1_seq1:1200-1619(+)
MVSITSFNLVIKFECILSRQPRGSSFKPKPILFDLSDVSLAHPLIDLSFALIDGLDSKEQDTLCLHSLCKCYHDILQQEGGVKGYSLDALVHDFDFALILSLAKSLCASLFYTNNAALKKRLQVGWSAFDRILKKMETQ